MRSRLSHRRFDGYSVAALARTKPGMQHMEHPHDGRRAQSQSGDGTAHLKKAQTPAHTSRFRTQQAI